MLGNKQLQASLKEANTHLESAQARIADLESDALTAQESLEEAKARITDLEAANAKSLIKLSEADAFIEELEKVNTENLDKLIEANASLEELGVKFDTAVATGVENRLADAAPDIPVAAAAAAESVTADFEAAYEASRAAGGASHAKFLNDNAEQIREYVEAQQG